MFYKNTSVPGEWPLESSTFYFKRKGCIEELAWLSFTHVDRTLGPDHDANAFGIL